MTISRQLWLLAGGNGAGKSTFYHLFLAPRGIQFVNADLIASEMDPAKPEKASYDAAYVAELLRENLLTQGISFCFETVFSHESKIDFVARAKALGYEIILVYIHLESPQLNAARVHQRVAEGGHNVPVEKIFKRIPRTMKHIATAASIVDEARLLDNSSRENPFRQVAIVKRGRREKLVNPLPSWAADILAGV